DHEVLDVVPVRSLTDAFALRVVDTDLRADVPPRRKGDELDVTARRTPLPQLFGTDPTFVRTRDHDNPGVDIVEHASKRDRHVAPPVEHRCGRTIAEVDALARHAVVLGFVGRD